jgi:pre-mRNA-splicing factor 18
MEALKAEIARKRKQLEETQVLGGGKKYFKRSELIAKEEEDYFTKHAPQRLREAQATAKAESDAKQVKPMSKTVLIECTK